MTDIFTQLTKQQSLLYRVDSDAYNTLIGKLDIAQTRINAEILKYETITPKLRRFINEQMEIVYADYDELMIKDIEEVVELSYDKTGAVMATVASTPPLVYKNAKDAVKSRLVNPNKLILGNTLKMDKTNLAYTQNKRLRQTIAAGFEDDLSIPVIQRQVRAVENANDLFAKIKRTELNTVVRTTLLNNIEDAKNEVLTTFENEDWFIGYFYSSVIDTRRSLYCATAHGYTVKDKSKAKYQPKTHYNCRSMWIPRTKFDEPIEVPATTWDTKTVNHRDGSSSTKFKVDSTKKVPQDFTNKDFYKSLPKEDRIMMMGKGRVELIESGKISFEDATKLNNNTYIPLRDLKEML